MNRFYYSLPTHYKLTTKVLQTSTNLYSSTRVWLRNPEFADDLPLLQLTLILLGQSSDNIFDHLPGLAPALQESNDKLALPPGIGLLAKILRKK